MKCTFGRAACAALGSFVAFSIASISHAQDAQVHAGDLRAPSPAIVNWDRPGYFQAGIGPSFASGLAAGDAMYNFNFSYNYNLSESFTGKAITDFNFGSSSSSARLINIGVGADAYFSEFEMRYGVPYLGADVGFGFARNEREQTRDAFTVGATAGFKFAAQAMNFDLNLHYAILTSDLAGENPSVLGVRLATNF